MKGKLHKMESGYILSLNGDIDDPYAIVNKELAEDYEWYKLSLKNCQEIENGYDLEAIIKETLNTSVHSITDHIKEEGFVIGFQKALEILGDKKFSEEDVIKVIEITRNGSMQEQHNGYGIPTESRFVLDNLPSDEIIQSLQQTEWDVEVEMIFIGFEMESGLKMEELKLDEEGCLILKKL
jgi:hypothetical protein